MVSCHRAFRCCLDSFCGIFFTGVFFGCWIGSVVYGLYAVTSSIHEINNMAATNCTILDANMNYDADTGPKWLIHVSYMIPTQLGAPVNTTEISSLIGTDHNAHYFVNQTLPCWVSAYNFYTVTISPFYVDGGTIFGLIMLVLMAMPVAVGIIYTLLIICSGTYTTILTCFKSFGPKTRHTVRPVDATESIEVDEAGHHWNRSLA